MNKNEQKEILQTTKPNLLKYKFIGFICGFFLNFFGFMIGIFCYKKNQEKRSDFIMGWLFGFVSLALVVWIIFEFCYYFIFKAN